MASITFLQIVLFLICYTVARFLLNKNGLPINWPVFGMLPDSLFHLHRFHDRVVDVLNGSGDTFSYTGPWFSNVNLLVTSDPTNIHYIMSSNFSNFPKGFEFSKIFDILGDGIFTSDSDSWKYQRRLAHSLINHRRFHNFLVKTSREMVEEGILGVLDHVAEKRLEVDFQDLFQRFTFDITCKLVTGYNPKCLSVEFQDIEFSKAMDEAEEVIFHRHIKPEYIWKLERWADVGQERKLRKARRILDHVSGEYISRKREQLIMSRNNDLISERDEEEMGVDLLTSYMNSEAKLDDKFLRDTIINFLLAGRDTTSSALTWFFWLISINPQAEDRILEELKALKSFNVSESSRVFDPKDVNKLVYLHGALCETLRLYPPVPFQHKAPVMEDVLPSGHRVNSEMKIVFSLYTMGRMESIWGKDCLEFKPERWITTGGKIKHEPSYKFLAFNAGPRTCLGKEIAFTQMKTVAASIIQNYKVKVVEGQKVTPASASIILHAKHGFKVKVSKRWV
ncbi:cytochrome P450 family 96 subfamily A polypeptide 10 [Euphorbia peplus]|nr:cytochrome P450 family 96 subfamily A polypeptide 10 [Euphorbia peplus]